MLIDITGEDFDWHWGFTDYKDKSIIDIGADAGSTVKCFFAKGATKVVAIEGDKGLYEKLKENYKDNPNVVCELCFIDSQEKMKALLEKYDADIIKVDIEFGEANLIGQDSVLLRKFPEWLLEGHSKELTNKLVELFSSIGYEMTIRKVLAGEIEAMHFRRK